MEVAKDLFKSHTILKKLAPYPVRYLLSHFYALHIFSYWGISFALLTFDKGFTFARLSNYYGYWVVLIGFLFFRFSGIVQKAQKIDRAEKLKKEEAQKKLAEDQNKVHDKVDGVVEDG